MAIYGHVQQLLRYGSKDSKSLILVRLGCLILTGHPCKIMGLSMPPVDVEEDG